MMVIAKSALRRRKAPPLLEVYSSAAWKQAKLLSIVSSMDSCMPKPASGLTLGRESRSVDRTKKFPWNVWILRPETVVSYM